MLDQKDKVILRILQNNARTSNAEIARHMNMTASAIYERVKKLEKAGVVKRYEARLDPAVLGLNLLAIVLITLYDLTKMRATGRELSQFDKIQEIHYIAGKGSIMAKVRTSGTEDLEKLLDSINLIENVKMTESTIVLKTEKETSALYLE
ncbi:MAG: Lrp/AsnC family transcriptional regulator [Candidatus Neomarinimicrobiota bacterium]|jgi:Lrp/AsnC family leucine-responsive transcriptional regulator|nr:Lrp/AsnC family transcriptional regulator [Candidatus Neomarinimicrobiota bacterium]MDD3965762.1 Lrp/AsnC family transcriptional regulator [Candidatus Neomarinimicrobiota bacterium]MDX9780045.1 Lrp/AsnC family transcriptional regulator [bacterium]